MKFARTRASDARPASAIPKCSSMPMIFFWYEDSSSAFLYDVYDEFQSGS